MKEYPNEIYLQVVPDDSEFYEPGAITWCADRINASDKKYIAEDVARFMMEREIEAMLSLLMPENMPLYKDSGAWQLRSDDMEDVVLQQDLNESSLEFFRRCKDYHLINQPE